MGTKHDGVDRKRTGRDYYGTPAHAVERLWAHIRVPIGATIVEPCAGNGNIVKASPPGYDWLAYDIVAGDYPLTEQCDFLAMESPPRARFCITNPPYGKLQEFLDKILEYYFNSALLLPLDALCTKKRRRIMLQYGPELLVFSRRLQFEGAGKGNPYNSAWFLFGWWRTPGAWRIVD